MKEDFAVTITKDFPVRWHWVKACALLNQFGNRAIFESNYEESMKIDWHLQKMLDAYEARFGG